MILSFGDTPRAGAGGKNIPLLLIILIIAACLIPFSHKPFNIDDPLFIWAADQIQIHPLDFYGFQVNWYSQQKPMFAVMQNPPLTSYYIALIMTWFGSGERILHLFFLLPAIAVGLGSYYLAKELCPMPLSASLMGLLTPAFLASGNTIMCDVMMLAFWVWAIFFWIRGLKEDKSSWLLASAIFICLSTLTKYFGISLVPLLFIYSLTSGRSLKRWIIFLLIPIFNLCLYEWITYALYGKGLFVDAFSYVNPGNTQQVNYISQILSGLAFAGGGFIPVLFAAIFSWPRHIKLLVVICIVLLIVILSSVPFIGNIHLIDKDGPRWLLIAQLAIFSTSGLTIITLAISDLVRHKNPISLLLFLWVTGIFLFAAFINWTTNIRSMLPMAPAVGILVIRRYYDMGNGEKLSKKNVRILLFPIVIGAIVGLLVTWADYTLAGSAKRASMIIAGKYLQHHHKVWFEGHWGFQYYMQAVGANPIDINKHSLEPDDVLVIPLNNYNDAARASIYSKLHPNEAVFTRKCKWLSTMNYDFAGFYLGMMGPLPYAFGSFPPECYYIFKFSKPSLLN